MKSFDEKKFLKFLDTSVFGRRIAYLPVTVSTNDLAADMLDNVEGSGLRNINGTVIVSDEQTGGRGRFSRGWLSPPGGLWFSLIFETGLSGDKIPAVTLIAAFSAAHILINSYDIDVSIKWPNDLYFMDQKFGGILSELKRTRSRQFIIMGMGLNIDIEKKFLKSLDNRAVNIQSLTKKMVEKEKLLAAILKRFEELYGYFSKTGDLNSIFKNIKKILRY